MIMEFNRKAAERADTTLHEIQEYLESLSYRLMVPRRDLLGYYPYERCERFDEARDCAGGEIRNVICVPDADAD